jgi:hypothetical protein
MRRASRVINEPYQAGQNKELEVQFLSHSRQAIERMGWLLVGATLCAQALAAQPVKNKPIAPAVREFIETTYGKWDAHNKGWRADDDSYAYHVCDVTRLTTGDGPRYLLAMCGNFVDTAQDGAATSAPDSTGGQTDLYVLKPTGDGKGLEPVIKQTNIASGNFGNAADVSIQQLGPHLYGFVIEDGVVLQGYVETGRSIWLPRPNKLVLAAKNIDVSMSNTGSDRCGKQPSACEEKEFDIKPDTASTDEVYPLKIHETGNRGDKNIDANYVIRFDPVKQTYLVPKAVSEQY